MRFDARQRRRQPVCSGQARPGSGAFTLIELILVLALLAIAASLITPSLSRFFRGQALGAEARQLLALAHAGHSRAISTGFPALLWVDTGAHEYGLEEENADATGAAETGVESFSYEAPLQIDVGDASPLQVNGRRLPAIRFLPDGSIDEASLTSLKLTGPDGDVLWLVQSTNGMNYEIRGNSQ